MCRLNPGHALHFQVGCAQVQYRSQEGGWGGTPKILTQRQNFAQGCRVASYDTKMLVWFSVGRGKGLYKLLFDDLMVLKMMKI